MVGTYFGLNILYVDEGVYGYASGRVGQIVYER